MKTFAIAAAVVALLTAGAASAATYNFDVTYNGGGSGSLMGGSDNPLTTTLNVGDTFNYRLLASGGNQWEVIDEGGGLFAVFALQISESGTRTVDFDLELFNDGASVFNFSQIGAINSFIHLGANTVFVSNGTIWDEIKLSATITASDAGSTPSSLVTFGGGPESWASSQVTYGIGGAIPEPTTWALLIGGFGLAGAALRRQRRAVAVCA